MAVATFDTLKFADTLKAAGVPAAQAEGQARAFAEIVQVQFRDLATRDDLDRHAITTKQELTLLRAEVERLAERFKRDLVEESIKLNGRIDKLDTKTDWQFTMLRWMLGATLSGVTALVIRMFFWKPGL